LAVVCLLLAISKIAWSGYTQIKLKEENYKAQTIPPISKATKPTYNINDVVSANLFGDPAPKVVVEKAPKTTLDLTLQGILWATDSNLGRAIIMSGKRKSELYSVGDTIKGAGASVKEIREGEVLLNRNGATESLPLQKKAVSGNREIISFSSPNPAEENVRPLVEVSNNSSNQRSIQAAASKPRAENGAPRKIRKPNFSGLDRALKKMGEI
jgi:type II secretion system protein C